jgi:hypothetical protein
MLVLKGCLDVVELDENVCDVNEAGFGEFEAKKTRPAEVEDVEGRKFECRFVKRDFTIRIIV